MSSTASSGLERVRRALRHAPGLQFLAECAYRSPGSWLFRGDNLEWLREEALVAQLPRAYRAFARYCTALGPNPVGAELLLRTIIRRRGGRDEDSVVAMAIHGTTVCLDLRDPRFLAIPNEIRRGLPRVLKRFLHPGDTFLDIGANHGTFSVTASRLVGASGRVIAIEPQERLANLVGRSLASGEAPCAVHQVACGSEPGETELYVPEASSGAAGLHKSYSAGALHRTARVRVVRLDDLVASEPMPGKVLVKIDVEGNESNCLRGATRFVAERRPPILIELNPRALHAAGSSVPELVSILQNLGYRHCLGGPDLTVQSPLTPNITDGNILALPNDEHPHPSAHPPC